MLSALEVLSGSSAATKHDTEVRLFPPLVP